MVRREFATNDVYAVTREAEAHRLSCTGTHSVEKIDGPKVDEVRLPMDPVASAVAESM